MEMLVLPINRTLQVVPGTNLLAALRENRIPVSHSCMSGRCGTCRCKVVSGQVLPSGHEAQMPTTSAHPFVLACQTVLTHNCVIEIPETDEIITHPARILRATIVAINPLTRDVRQLKLQLAKSLEYSPGQHVQLRFGNGLTRPYSMASVSHEALEFHLRLVPGGRLTEHFSTALSVGDVVRVTGPLGTAYLRGSHSGPMICIAGSTGLAPILSILRGAVQRNLLNPIHVYYGTRSHEDLYGVDWLQELAASNRRITIHLVITSGRPPNGLRSGLVTDAVASDWATLHQFRAYVCGPPPMVESATMLLQQRGVARDHIHADAFYPAGT